MDERETQDQQERVETTPCPVCGEVGHKVTEYSGIRFIGCPEMGSLPPIAISTSNLPTVTGTIDLPAGTVPPDTLGFQAEVKGGRWDGLKPLYRGGQ